MTVGSGLNLDDTATLRHGCDPELTLVYFDAQKWPIF
jgi:hypothetical protein